MANISSVQIDLIHGWFERIYQLARDDRQYYQEKLLEIAQLAKEAQEHMKCNIT